MTMELLFMDCLNQIDPSNFVNDLYGCVKMVDSYVKTHDNIENRIKGFTLYFISYLILLKYELHSTR